MYQEDSWRKFINERGLLINCFLPKLTKEEIENDKSVSTEGVQYSIR